MLVSSVSDGKEEILIGVEREDVKKVELISKSTLENTGVIGIKTKDTFIPLVTPSGILKGKIKVKYAIITEKVALGVTRVVGFLKPIKEMMAKEIADFVSKAFETSEGMVLLVDVHKIHSSGTDMEIIFETDKMEGEISSNHSEGETLIVLSYEGKDWVVKPENVRGIVDKMNEFAIGGIKGFVTYENRVIPVIGKRGKWIVIFENVGLLCDRVDRLKGTILDNGKEEKWAVIEQRKIPFLTPKGVKRIGI